MRRLLTITCALAFVVAPHFAMAASEFTEAQKAQIESIVRTLLTEKEPELVMRAAQEVQQRQESIQNKKAQKAVSENKDKIFKDPTSQVVGNPRGDVTVVEFYDYQCGYCKMAHQNIQKLLAGDKNVRLVYKEYPILGPDSTKAAKASLAAARQGKFEAFHNALMGKKDHVSDALLDSIAEEVGMNVSKMHKDMESKEVQDILDANAALGQSIGANGTPMFVIGEETFPGAISAEQMQDVVNAQRNAKKK